MARAVFPQDALALGVGDTAGSIVISVDGASMTVFADPECTQRADVRNLDGSVITGSTLRVSGGKLPDFLGPDGVYTLWTPGAAGVPNRLESRFSDRLSTIASTPGPAGDSALDEWKALNPARASMTAVDMFNSLKGDRGIPGAPGRDGVDGKDSTVPGPAGPAGAASTVPGPQGPAGLDGKSAYQQWLDAGNTGTQADFLASLKGVKGDPGATGATGATGAASTVPGPQGPAGLDGKSAYQQWLDAGNTGTQADFLASLKGVKGDTGATGATGAASTVPGPQGPTGNTGPAGPGVAAGGASGMLLAKNSAADYDTKWIAPPSGGGGGGALMTELDPATWGLKAASWSPMVMTSTYYGFNPPTAGYARQWGTYVKANAADTLTTLTFMSQSSSVGDATVSGAIYEVSGTVPGSKTLTLKGSTAYVAMGFGKRRLALTTPVTLDPTKTYCIAFMINFGTFTGTLNIGGIQWNSSDPGYTRWDTSSATVMTWGMSQSGFVWPTTMAEPPGNNLWYWVGAY